MKRITLQESYGFSSNFTNPEVPVYTIPQRYDVGLFNQSESRENVDESQSSTMISNIRSYEAQLFMSLSESENSLFGHSSTRTGNRDIAFDTAGIVESPLPNSQCINFSESQQLLNLKNNLLGDLDHDPSPKIDSCSFNGYRDIDFSGNSYESHFAQMDQFGAPSCLLDTSGNSNGSLGPASSSKTRIRWSQDLHDRFVECVNRLGGPEKATPKAILLMMDTEKLTILHVKSHLQKYRNTKYVTGSVQGRHEKRTTRNNVEFDIKTGMELKEALRLQIDVQKRLHEQLEIQRNLQLRIEEQGKQLKMMLSQQQISNQNLRKSYENCPNILSTAVEDTDDEILVSEAFDDDFD